MNKYFTILAFSLIISFYSLSGFAQWGTGMFTGSNDLDFLKAQEKPTLIIFHANWCLPCKMVNKWVQEDIKIKNLIENYDVEHYDYDLDKMMRTKYNVRKIPTLIVIQNGEEKARKVGIATGKKGLELFLESYKGA